MNDFFITFIITLISWLALHLLGQPILEFISLRKKIHEQLIYMTNIWGASDETELREKLKEYDALRRLSAQLTALDNALKLPSSCFSKLMSFPSKFVINNFFKVDLHAAAQQLLIYETDRMDFQDKSKIRTNAQNKIIKALGIPPI